VVLSDRGFLDLSEVTSITKVEGRESVWQECWWLLKVKAVIGSGDLRGLKVVLNVRRSLRRLVQT
jgi:hypothetical protein